MSESLIETPDHVPPELVVDFDCFGIDVPDGDAAAAWRRVADAKPPVFWTNHNGGHWVATTGEAVKTIQVDHTHFSMSEFSLPRGRRGMCAPPVDTDPPAHAGYRRIVQPAFNPKVIDGLENEIRDTIRAVVERLAPLGQCEFVTEVSQVLPITVFLGMMGLPLEDAKILLPLAHLNSQAKELEVSQATRKAMADYIFDAVQDRRAHPKDDVLTRIVQSEYDGRPLTDDELRGMGTVILGGGLDTVAGMMGFFARFLATHPEHRDYLAEDLSRLPAAIEELIRRHALVNTSRLVREDYELHGVLLKKDDIIQIPNCFYGLDPAIVPDPMNVDFERPGPVKHAAFGSGVHFCLGAPLARLELRVWLEEWLRRIPRFKIKPGTAPVSTIGGVSVMRELWLQWPVVADEVQ